MSAKNIDNTIIFQHLVKKNFTNTALLYREAVGTMLAGLVKMTDQKMVISTGNLMVDKVAGVTLSNLSEQMNDDFKFLVIEKLAAKLKAVKNNYRSKVGIFDEVFGCLSFESLIKRNKETLFKLFPNIDIFKKLTEMSKERMTICHGDLNLSNLMLSGSELVLIDFEHVTEAPLEYDLASSFVFDDEKSIDLKMTIKALENIGQKISMDDLRLMAKLFLANQVSGANKEKMKSLINKAKERNIL